MNQDGEDIIGFSSPEANRFATDLPDCTGIANPFSSLINTSQSLPQRREPISTSLSRLNDALGLPAPAGPSQQRSNKVLKLRLPRSSNPKSTGAGIRHGEITELVGSSGLGKTAIALELAVNTLRKGETVVWIDTASPLNSTRVKDVLNEHLSSRAEFSAENEDSTQKPSCEARPEDLLKHLLHLQVSTLSHLIALISYPPAGFPPSKTGLIVVDSLSSLISAEFRTRLPQPSKAMADPFSSSSSVHGTTDARLKQEAKEERLRWKVIGNLMNGLKKLSASLDCAVVVINQMVTHFRSGMKPVLRESLLGTTYEMAISTKIVLYWSTLPRSRMSSAGSEFQGVRIAEVVKLGEVTVSSEREKRIAPFAISKTGVREIIDNNRLMISASSR